MFSGSLKALRPARFEPWSTVGPACGGPSSFQFRPAIGPAGWSVPQEVAMRETLGRHIDLVVVIWVLTLALGWSVLALSRAQLSADQWSSAPQSGAAWVIPSGDHSQ